MRWVDRLAESFGSLGFLLAYNVATFIWVGLGIAKPQWWPDPYPGNFYTLLVSWLAINMSSLVLWSQLRAKYREEKMEQADRRMLKAMYTLIAETEAEMERAKEQQKMIVSLLDSQLTIIEQLRKGDGTYGQRGAADRS